MAVGGRGKTLVCARSRTRSGNAAWVSAAARLGRRPHGWASQVVVVSRRPEAMTQAHYERLRAMTNEQRHRVMERAAIIRDGNPGMGWPEADERALASEGFPIQRRLVVG